MNETLDPILTKLGVFLIVLKNDSELWVCRTFTVGKWNGFQCWSGRMCLWKHEQWCRWTGLNSRPRHYQWRALPLSYSGTRNEIRTQKVYGQVAYYGFSKVDLIVRKILWICFSLVILRGGRNVCGLSGTIFRFSVSPQLFAALTDNSDIPI